MFPLRITAAVHAVNKPTEQIMKKQVLPEAVLFNLFKWFGSICL